MKPKTIDIETVHKEPESTALVHRQSSEVGHALTPSEITERLRFIKQVMSENMKEGTDYGKVPGCGDKPGLFQPGAQKLSMTFQLNPEVLKEEITDYQNYNRGYRLIVRVTNGSKFADGVGECSTLEAKYRWRQGQRVCPDCHKPAIIVGKAQYGGGFVCFKKKDGCGAKFADNDERILRQDVGRVENENPADHWNTVRKMAFKRAFVHAIINATNTSELWSQDLEDLHGNNVSPHPETESESDGIPAGRPHERPDDGYLPKEDGADLGPQKQAQTKPAQTKQQERGLAPVTAPVSKFPTAATRGWMIEQLDAVKGSPSREMVTGYLRGCGQLLPSEEVEDLPLRFVPSSMKELRLMLPMIAAFGDGQEFKAAFPPHPEPEKEPAKEKAKPAAKKVEVPRDSKVGEWRNFPILFGKNAGVPMGKLEPNSLTWYCLNFEVKESFEGRNGKTIKKSPEALIKDRAFRSALDAAMAELGISKQKQERD